MDFLRRLFAPPDQPHPLDRAPSSAPVPSSDAPLPVPIQPKVLAIIHNPVMPDGRKIQRVYGWNDPDKLAQGCIDDLREVSYGYVNYQIAERIEVNGFPLKQDGFRYTPESFASAWQSRKFHDPDAVDYLALVREFDVINRINARQIDEVWLLGFPYCGYYESIMGGSGAFWCNAPPLKGTEQKGSSGTDRRFVMMGFNYERGVGEMLEDFGHRAESMLTKVFERRRGDANLWERFSRYDKIAPGRAECGNVHFAPNSSRDYDWGNPRPVLSRADHWLRFPNLAGDARTMTCADWGSGDIRAHHLWWMRHFPHIEGEANGIASNWWRYVIDPNTVP